MGIYLVRYPKGKDSAVGLEKKKIYIHTHTYVHASSSFIGALIMSKLFCFKVSK